MTDPIKYTVDPRAPFPKRWYDKIGNITVMHEPVKGYVMCRRKGAHPFVLSVREILNAVPHSHHGPFTCVDQIWASTDLLHNRGSET